MSSRVGRYDPQDAPRNRFADAGSNFLSAGYDDGFYAEKRTPTASGHCRRQLGITLFWTETFACFFAIVSILAAFGTLYPFHGRPLPQWPFSMGVNTLLAIYTLILKAAVGFLLSQGIALQKWQWFDGPEKKPLYDYALFDDATRGPIGAIRLLWRLPFRHAWHWLGCVLLLVVLFVDPFTQQVLQYTDCTVPDAQVSASIPRSNIFVGGANKTDYASTLSLNEQAAIQAGLVQPRRSLDATCTSGNCTFPRYGSIAYCSSCVDVSASAVVKAQNLTTLDFDYPGVLTSTPDLSNHFVYDETSNFSTLAVTQRTNY